MADRHASGSFAWPGHLGVRSSLSHGRIARVLFCVEQECMVLLHGFMKKTQKTAKA
jgi:phage-related protein